MTIHWRCLHCTAAGTTTGGDKGADARQDRVVEVEES